MDRPDSSEKESIKKDSPYEGGGGLIGSLLWTGRGRACSGVWPMELRNVDPLLCVLDSMDKESRERVRPMLLVNK